MYYVYFTMHFSPLLAEKFVGFDLEWYLVSEKVDGYRAVYFNGVFWTRTGNVINAPEWFTRDMPRDVFLDGELFTERGDFSGVSSILRKKVPFDREWKGVVYLVFDVPKIVEPFTKRYRYLKSVLGCKSSNGNFIDTRYERIKVLKQYKVTDLVQVEKVHSSVIVQGGEGVMLRDPDSYYVNKRSMTLQKYKHFHDQEAIVEGYTLGEGKHTDKMGKLCVRWISDGVSFKVGTGFTDHHRINVGVLFPKGTVIKVKYFEKTSIGKPRFPVYIGTVPKVLDHNSWEKLKKKQYTSN